MAEPPRSAPKPEGDGADKSHHGAFTRAAETFIFAAAALYGLAALSMAVVSFSLVIVSVTRVYTAFITSRTPESVLLDAVSSLVISVAILDVAKYVMEEEVLRSRELRMPHEAREAVTKFMVIIALVVSIEGIVLVFELGKEQPELLLYPVLLLSVSVFIVVGLGVFQRLSLKSEARLSKTPRDDPSD